MKNYFANLQYKDGHKWETASYALDSNSRNGLIQPAKKIARDNFPEYSEFKLVDVEVHVNSEKVLNQIKFKNKK